VLELHLRNASEAPSAIIGVPQLNLASTCEVTPQALSPPILLDGGVQLLLVLRITIATLGKSLLVPPLPNFGALKNVKHRMFVGCRSAALPGCYETR